MPLPPALSENDRGVVVLACKEEKEKELGNVYVIVSPGPPPLASHIRVARIAQKGTKF